GDFCRLPLRCAGYSVGDWSPLTRSRDWEHEMPGNDESERVFAELKRILKKHAPRLVVVKDYADSYYLDTKTVNPRNKQRIFFGAVRRGKNYVSYYLMPVYGNSALLKGMSPELKKRMQGKSCFNFKTVDPALFKELAALTKQGFECFQTQGWI